MSFAVADGPVAIEVGRELRDAPAHHHRQAHVDVAAIDGGADGVDRRERLPRVLEAGDPFRDRFAIRETQRLAEPRRRFVGRRRRLAGAALDELRGVLAQESGRLALRVS